MSAEDSCFAGANAEQIAMMDEECILLDADDNVIGHDTKKNCHLNTRIFPENEKDSLLHRAFSVFIFNKKGELLMQKRSADKITFPSYWANTCCSHPLYRPEELDGEEGAKRAAIRKIEQELGIPPSKLPMSSFEFVTKIYYKARSDEVWGEHEIDYILVCRPPEDVIPEPNPNEVAEARYFSKAELDEFVATSDEKGVLVSPWFRVIHTLKLSVWWDALLQDRLSTVLEKDAIHRWGMAGNTTEEFGNGQSTDSAAPTDLKKQGAYGKVKIHSHSLLSQLCHVDEVSAAIRMKYFSNALAPELKGEGTADEKYAVEMMNKTSRSFAAVTMQLPAELCMPVCIFYLTLRALDTIEDDMHNFSSVEEKINHLRTFYKKLDVKGWTLDGIGEGDERLLLNTFDRIISVFQSLKPEYREVIADITRRMGEGMAEYVDRDMTQGTKNVSEYNLYCFYVAGLVGEGLSALFSSSKLESESVVRRKYLSHSMGHFLQKVNIIRDYLEDYVDGRSFWPATIWKKHAQNLGDLAEKKNLPKALHCLNEMILDALQHIPDCLEYLRQLENKRVFRFCAIPQVMAISTLDAIFNNPKVFTGVVKIRKGMAAQLILDTASIADVESVFLRFTRSIVSKVNSSDPSTEGILSIADKVEGITAGSAPLFALPETLQKTLNILSPGLFLGLMWYFFRRQKGRGESSLLPPLTDTMDVAALALMFIVIAYMFGFLGIPFSQSYVSSNAKKASLATEKKDSAQSKKIN